MPSLVPGFSYDIFISYRQKDNQYDGWVTEFVENLRKELDATFKDPVSIYFDVNPHDGLLESHQVEKSLEDKLRCVIFIPILSQTYCDPRSYAWTNELIRFRDQAAHDSLGLTVKLRSGNVASRILPVRIHEMEQNDRALFERETGGPLRSIDFVFRSPGVNRSLRSRDDEFKGTGGQALYRDQVNKVANAVKEILQSLEPEGRDNTSAENVPRPKPQFKDRGVIRAGLMYVLLSLVGWRIAQLSFTWLGWSDYMMLVTLALICGFPIAVFLAWRYERSPGGFVRIGSPDSQINPLDYHQRKPLTSNTFFGALLLTLIALWLMGQPKNKEVSQSSIAVLPFSNFTGDQNLDFFGYGLASEVRSRLATSRQFDFISSMIATSPLKDTRETPFEIGKKLNVTHILTGSYVGSARELEVSVELVDSKSGKMVWNLTRKIEISDVFKFRTIVANEILAKLNGALLNQEDYSTNIEAFAEYTRGIEMSRLTHDHTMKLKYNRYFRNAIRLDSSFLPAWKELIANFAFHSFNDPGSEPAMRDSIAPLMKYVVGHFKESWMLKELYGIHAYHLERDFRTGKKFFLETLEENPEAEYANGLLAAIYRREMDWHRSIQYRLKRLELSPDPQTWREVGMVYSDYGDFGSAESSLLNAFRLNNAISDQLYDLKVWQNKIEELPKELKLARGNRFVVDSIMQQRQWKYLLSYLSTLRSNGSLNELDITLLKAKAYHAMALDDSAGHFARQYFTTKKRSVTASSFDLMDSDYLLEAMLGKAKESNEYIGWSAKQLEQDALYSFYLALQTLRARVLSRDYAGATHELKQLNKQFPKYGNYLWLNLPEMDRIKKEYPAFQRAIEELKFPPKLSETVLFGSK